MNNNNELNSEAQAITTLMAISISQKVQIASLKLSKHTNSDIHQVAFDIFAQMLSAQAYQVFCNKNGGTTLPEGATTNIVEQIKKSALSIIEAHLSTPNYPSKN